MTIEKINEIRNKVYEITCSMFPLGDFFNDIETVESNRYNKEQAYLDMEKIADVVIKLETENERLKKAIKIIKKVYLNNVYLSKVENINDDFVLMFNNYMDVVRVSKEEYALLQEVLGDE